MIKTYCDNVVGIYTNCQSVVAVYTYCDLVWEQGPVPPGDWYVSWTPDWITGSFSMFGQYYNLYDYSGFYSWTGVGSGIVTYRAFRGLNMETMETNVKSIDSHAFAAQSLLLEANMYKCIDIYDNAFYNCRSLQTVNLPKCKTIGSYAFERCKDLQYISLPRCRTIDSAAFSSCTSLSYAYLPVLEDISYATFQNCTSLESMYAPNVTKVSMLGCYNCGLTTLDLPSCSYIDVEAFENNYNLSQVSLPLCEYVGTHAFGNCYNLQELYLPACITFNGAENCSSLSSVDLPVATTVRITNCNSLVDVSAPSAQSVIFYSCSNLSYISLPECTTLMGDYSPSIGAFEGCTHLRSISLPKLESMTYNAFKSCTLLSSADLGSVHSITIGAFYDCVNLDVLVLNYDSVVLLGPDIMNFQSQHIDSIFHGSPIMNCQGAVYVPIYMYREYQADSRWSHISCAIKSMIPEPGSYYVSWHPTPISGEFRLNGHKQYCEDYTDGVFAWFDGVIESSAFMYSYRDSHMYIELYKGCDFQEVETNAYRIENGAFEGCSLMSTIFLHSCSYLGSEVFRGCASLSRFSAPYVEYVGGSCFFGCNSLSSIYLPACISVSSYAFSMYNATSGIVDLPVCQSIDSYAFRGNSRIASVNLPSVSYLESYTFQSCYRLSTVSLPMCEFISDCAFSSCSALRYLDLPICSGLGRSVFQSNTNLTLVLRSTSVVTLSYLLMGIKSVVSIYVPSSLVDAYKSTRYWSTYSSNIFPIPEP